MKIFDAIRAGWRWLFHRGSPSRAMQEINYTPAPLPWASPSCPVTIPMPPVKEPAPEARQLPSVPPEVLANWARALKEAACGAAEAFEKLARAAENAARAMTDANLIDQYATPKEIHYIIHGRKARTRKKYRNRVLRRAQRKETHP